MKTVLLTAALALTLAGSAAFAQTAPPQDQAQPRMHNPHRAAMRMGRELNLAPDQTAKLEPILADRQQKVQAIRANTALTDDQRRAQMRTVMQGTRMQLANVLSPEQMKQWKEMRHNRKHGQDTAAQPQGV